MNVTTSDILNERDRLIDAIEDEGYDDTYQRIKNAIKEKEIQLASFSVCDEEIKQFIMKRYQDIDQTVLSELSVSNFYDNGIMQTISCMFESKIFFGGKNDIDYLRAKKLFHNLFIINSDSSYGIATKAAYDELDRIFVVKTPQDKEGDSLLHELIVGCYGTNYLRKFVPNFSYVYGGFKCGMPVIDEGNIVTFCSESDYVTHVVYENIEDSISAAEYMRTATSGQFMSIFLQIVFSLRIAQAAIDFTHYDLHNQNVLVKKHLGLSELQIPYSTDMGVEYLKTDRVAMIIDYGMSHFCHIEGNEEKVMLGYPDKVKYSIYPLESHIFHDIYKFMMFCGYESLRYNKDRSVFEVIETLFYFFNKEEKLEDILKQHPDQGQVGLRFDFPYTEKSVDDFIAYIRERIDLSEILSPQGDQNLFTLSCGENCNSIASYIVDVGIGGNYFFVEDIIDYSELIRRGINDGVAFDYDLAVENFMEMTNGEKEVIFEILQRMQTTVDLKIFLYLLLSVLDKYFILYIENKLANAVANYFGKEEIEVLDSSIYDQIEEGVSKMEQQDISKIENLEDQKERELLFSLMNKVRDYLSSFLVI